MNYIYPAVFYPEENGQYSVVFPDLNNLATYGNDLTDAFSMAQEACTQYLFTSLCDGEALPSPSSIEEIKKDGDCAFINLVCVDIKTFASDYNDKTVKKTITIPAWLNTACNKAGINYSKFLKEALIERLQMTS